MKAKSFILFVLFALLQSSVMVAQEPSNIKEFEVNGVKFKLVEVPGGKFKMTDDYIVQLDTYYIGQTEVTQELWTAVMKKNPSENVGDQYPVENISWSNCQKFIKKLNALTGANFRLPTEAEWTYAAIGGSKSRGTFFSGSNKLNEVGWYEGNVENYINFIANKGNKRQASTSTKQMTKPTIHEVAKLQPNELGIYDMSGNVFEWCEDWFEENLPKGSKTNPTGPESGSVRVYRGGGWNSTAETCAISFRGNSVPFFKFNDLGFRLVLVP